MSAGVCAAVAPANPATSIAPAIESSFTIVGFLSGQAFDGLDAAKPHGGFSRGVRRVDTLQQKRDPFLVERPEALPRIETPGARIGAMARGVDSTDARG